MSFWTVFIKNVGHMDVDTAGYVIKVGFPFSTTGKDTQKAGERSECKG